MQQPPTHTQPVSIASTFREATVLLTGATGFVGSLLLEALLRTTDVQRVYVLLRPKGGDSPQARLEKLLQVRRASPSHPTSPHSRTC
jgi:fatty acyl-CoA reductase